MRHFRVVVTNGEGEETEHHIKASLFILREGALIFLKSVPSPESDEVVYAYAPGEWRAFLEVKRDE